MISANRGWYASFTPQAAQEGTDSQGRPLPDAGPGAAYRHSVATMDTSKDAPVEAWSEERDALIVHAPTGRLVVASQQPDFQGLYFLAGHGD